jgi:hypothetical protein
MCVKRFIARIRGYGACFLGFALFLVRLQKKSFSGKKDGRPERCRNPRQHPSEPPTHLSEGEHYPTKNKSSETAEIAGKLRKNRFGLE